MRSFMKMDSLQSIPIRYGVNIMDWRWKQRMEEGEKVSSGSSSQKYVYDATAVTCSKENSDPVTFFSYEWENARYGEKIAAVNLKSVPYSKNNENAIILLAISVSDNNQKASAEGTEQE